MLFFLLHVQMDRPVSQVQLPGPPSPPGAGPEATNRARASLVAELRESILSSRSISESIYLPICLPPPNSLFLSFLVHPLRYF